MIAGTIADAKVQQLRQIRKRSLNYFINSDFPY